jgi:hypothetical protein
VSHAGHGTNSYAINYHLVYRRLALFSQVLWGGLYTDKASSTAAVAELFGYCKALIDAAEQCAAETEAPTRLVCLYSSMRGVATVGWVKPPQDGAKVVWQLLELSPLDRNAVLPEAERLLRAGP